MNVVLYNYVQRG